MELIDLADWSGYSRRVSGTVGSEMLQSFTRRLDIIRFQSSFAHQSSPCSELSQRSSLARTKCLHPNKP
jgi:hypothetical protein